jgi:hypothetical protein
MFKKISDILVSELKILRLRKQIRALETQGEGLALVLKKEELLVQLQINLLHPIGFKDMKHLAIAEIKKDLMKVARPAKAQRVKARKLVLPKKLETIEVL